ncbi:Ig-like domain-containing protein [Ichthyenterobacterium magnum]|uniref:Ig-like domain-containing protein n=1 Tax=Ichthyenterobacterium magnum TaxID=1230530 RepID=A0A420DWG0_9FLAO|nr:Ig-like domain-containing protein [Ichthyenterobacterium magnum]RKE98549.1 Ig-like domain-containing protein [Ichthyenterobacterium magnum]
MLKSLFQNSICLFILLMLASCANRGTPSGGEKDIDPPQITKTIPKNFSTNFTDKEIYIHFNEYVKIKDLQKQLIISPPMDPEPIITPLGTASKYIKIVIKDTLAANTTYAFNFGESIVDNNEGNPYSYYKYVLSTGTYIDSLSVKGMIFDAINRKSDEFVSVMLYDIDSTFTDSIIYKQKPKYVTNTLDSVTSFSIDNIKAGKYLLVAIKDENGNFTYQQKSDKIGFYDDIISVPTDSVYSLKLFKEELDFKALRPKQVAGQKIAFGYEGDYKAMQIEMLSPKPEGFEKRITKDKSADSLFYWYKPKLELDSTRFVVTNKTYIDTLKFRFRSIDKDTLIINSLQSGGLNFDEDFTIEGSIPLISINEKAITILDKDSLNVPFTTRFNTLENSYAFKFNKKESDTYKVQMLPNTFEDFFGNTNDTLNYTLRTKTYADFSNVRVTLKNVEYPVIVQLTDAKDEMKYELFASEAKVFDFRNINPGNYYLRVVFDTNANQKWDSGNYLKKRQPERISYYPDLIDARANWDPIIEFVLE